MLLQDLGWSAFIVTWGLGLFFVYQVGLTIYNVLFHPLSKYPGPKIAAATQIPCAWYTIKGKQGQWIEELHNRYDSDVVRISPRELSFINPSAWKDIHGARPGRKALEKDPAVYRKPPNSVASLVSSSTADHTRMRRVFAHGFSDKAFREQEPIVESYVDTLIERLREQVDGFSKGRVDISQWFRWTAFDISGDLAFGESFNCLQSQSLHPWAGMLPGFLKADMCLAAVERFSSWRVLEEIILSGSTKRMMKDHWAATVEKLSRRLKLGSERPDFISPVLKFNEQGKGMTDAELQSNASLFIIAGSDSTATILTGTIYYLTQHPEYLKKATAEVRSAFKSEEEIVSQNVGRLPLTIACIDETSRIYPTILTGSQVITPPEGDMVGNEWIPGNTGLAINMYAAYRSSRNFKDPLQFIPERWLGDPRFAEDKREIFWPFSYGHRSCLGKNLGTLEPRLVLARLLWNFDIELCDDIDPNWLDQEAYTTWQRKELFVRLSKKA